MTMPRRRYRKTLVFPLDWIVATRLTRLAVALQIIRPYQKELRALRREVEDLEKAYRQALNDHEEAVRKLTGSEDARVQEVRIRYRRRLDRASTELDSREEQV